MGMYENHLVAFVDFLGFQEALAEGGRADSILELLTTISGFQGDFQSQQVPAENGQTFNIRPAIAAFSDNIVISYPLERLVGQNLDVGIAIIFLQTLISYIAWKAFNARLLIRGGVAVGQAFHKNGVVFGPALVEAYETERKLAIYPRIALGPSITCSDAMEKVRSNVVTHEDGVAALAYLSGFILRFHPVEGKGIMGNLMVASWLEEVRRTIRQESLALTTAKRVGALAKWKWFEAKFEDAVAKMHPELLKDHPSPPGNVSPSKL